jgi:uncharacterized oligopeptide transporter (OPT) family protein
VASHVEREPQLTLRAAIMGMLLGMVMAVSNLYLGLKTGSSVTATITACVLAYAAFSLLHRLFPRSFPAFGMLENNAMQSCASAASAMASSGLINAIPALMLIDAGALPASHWQLSLWIVAVSLLGVFMAIPAKRQMIDIEELPFPNGIAAASLVQSLHGDRRTARRQTRALGAAGLIAAGAAWLRDAAWPGMPYPNLPALWGTSGFSIGAYSLPQLTVAIEGSPMVFGALGALVGLRQASSLLLGAAVNYLVLAPAMLDRHVIARPGYSAIVAWSLWIGVPMLVTSSFTALALQWRTASRAFSAMVSTFEQSVRAEDTDVPRSWFVIGFGASAVLTIALGQSLFHIAWWMGAVAVISCFPLVIVAARAVGETAQTPQGALSKITQFTFGALDPTRTSTNLMTANITAGATAHAGDLLEDLKCGHLLGASARQQFLAQLIGVLAGGLVAVPAFYLLVPNPSVLGTDRWPAPSALVWRGVASLVARGFGALDPTARIGFVAGALVGILLPLLYARLPKLRAYIPSATGIGIAFTIPAFACISMFLGAVVAWAVEKVRPRLADEFTVPVASGLIVGESLIGVLIALFALRGWVQ